MISAVPILGLTCGKGVSCPDLEGLKVASQDILDASVRRAELPGVVAMLARHSCPVIIVRSGWQDVQKRLRMRKASIFDIRSITKPVTALAALILVEKKQSVMV